MTTTARGRCSGKLLLLAALSGAILLHAELTRTPLSLQTLLSPAPPSLSTTLRGFSDALRWLESLNSREDLTALAAMVAADHLANATEPQRLEDRWVSPGADAVVARAAARQLPSLAAKTLLQWSLVLFVLRVRALSKRRAVVMLCLCVLVLAARVAAHSTASKLLSTLRTPPTAEDAGGDHLESTARLLNALFLVRVGASAVVSAVLARAFQLYLCEPWPAVRTHWRRIPKYLGSKNLVISTLFTVAAAVALLSICAAELRALSAAAERIESVALGASLLHLLFISLAPQAQPQPEHSS